MEPEEPVSVADVMSSPIETVSPDATVREAAEKMRDREVSALLVTTSPAGIVTSTDVLNAVAEGHDPSTLRVSDVMTASVETVTPDLHLEEAAAMMTTFGIKHLPVVDDDYVGMLSSTDITAEVS
ncbi:MAG: cyclic nucleotide-binding/CBS domain-containing protein [Halobacteriales archaeon]